VIYYIKLQLFPYCLSFFISFFLFIQATIHLNSKNEIHLNSKGKMKTVILTHPRVVSNPHAIYFCLE